MYHLRGQNAGLLLTVRQDDILFEAFELLAPNENVMSCEGSLLREFPDRAAAVTRDKLGDDGLLDVLVDCIQKLEVGIASVARPKTFKAKTVHPEERDTLSPVLATGLLIDMLVGLGRSVDPDRITKRSREQVNWDDAFLPFHRSPTWLLLRVALRLVLDRSAVQSGGESWYKPLITYHHARLLSMAAEATKAPIPSDKLFSMNAKLARRIFKLGPKDKAGWLKEVNNTVLQSQTVLNQRWKMVQNEDAKLLPLDELPGLSFHEDCALKLENLRAHLSWIDSRSTDDRKPTGPGDITRFTSFRNSGPPALNCDAPKNGIMNLTRLLDFEAWVEFELRGWSSSQLDHDACNADDSRVESAVRTLQSLTDKYYELACAAYEGSPDALSVMYLVIMELWVAMDKIAGSAIPLLLDYNPGFPLDAFCPLLLERQEDMARLQNLESYLSRRESRAQQSYPSAFEGFGREDSFAVRFFQTSAKHQRLRVDIETWAYAKREEKMREYETTKAKHDELAERHRTTDCDYYWDSRWEERSHFRWCARCQLEQDMQSLKIDVFEWPLPTSSNHADAAVVEISLPRVVQMWRDATWKLVTEVFREGGQCRGGGGEKLYFAGGNCGLELFFQRGSRLRPASSVKPMEVSHYRVKHILEASPENICVPHAARYEYYDEPSKLIAVEEVPGVCIPPHCSYAELVKGLPAVEDWVRSAKHSSNDVIAGQGHCPLDTTLEEFRAFGTLRSGFTLQWANILCQLVMPSLDFNKKQTLSLILQACLEAGPGNDSVEGVDSIWREAHIDTQKESFMTRMLQALDEAVERVRESWQNDIALCLLACLATRLLSLSPSTEISNGLLRYLAQVRKASIDWARLLLDRLNRSEVDRERQEWSQRVLMAALITATTFNVGEERLASVLNDPECLAVFVESAVLARNHLPASGRPSDPIARQLVRRWHLVMYQACDNAMYQVVSKGNSGLDTAIKQFWAAYSPSSAKWIRPGIEGRRHILENTSSVTFNFLTGNLFLNGYPLSKLPLDYQQHATFSQLFGEQILDVGPSSFPGMQFSASRDQHGWVVYFAMKDGQLVVRAVQQTDQSGSNDADSRVLDIWEYIPRNHLDGDLPDSFVYNYAHWLNLSTDEIEFRPIAHKWVTSSTNWHLTRLGGKDVLREESRLVIDPNSPTATLVHRILGSIESPRNIDPIFDCDARTLFLGLPRLCLSFSVREGEAIVESKNYAGMQIDHGQGINTLIGLLDKLVLKQNGGSGFRIILIPRGQVSGRYIEISDHVEVSILRAKDSFVRHDSFVVNTTLGCLTDTGSLQSKLYLCWLHALTSHSLPDPLTLRTGTEESLRIMGGAAVRSYPSLDHDAREFLGQITKLSPQRHYYPKELRVMEQTKWNYNIPPLSQHDDFWPLAKSIYEDYETFGDLFQLAASEEDSTSAARVFTESNRPRSGVLEERARIRNAIFRVTEFGAEKYTTAMDKWYRPTDRKNTGRANARDKVACLARCVDTGCERLFFSRSKDLPQSIISVNGEKFSGNRTAKLAFNLKYLAPPSESLEGHWCGLHRELAREKNKYKKIFFLSSLLYAEGSDQHIVQALMALGSIPLFSQPKMLPPSETEFDLTVHRRNLSDSFTSIVEEGSRHFDECPEAKWTRNSGESIRTFEARQHQAWRSNSKDMVWKFVAALDSQIGRGWTVATPDNQYYGTYLDTGVIMPRVRDRVEMARRSEEFQSYLDSLSTSLSHIGIMETQTLIVGSTPREARPVSKPGFIAAMSLFSQAAPSFDRPQPELFSMLCSERQRSEQQHSKLSALVDELSAADSLQGHQALYLDELRCSMDSPAAPNRFMKVPKEDATIQAALNQNLQAARDAYDTISDRLTLALTGTSIAHQICENAGIKPRISPIFSLQRLSRPIWMKLSMEWRKSLVNLALSLIYLQRAERLASHGANLPDRWSDLLRELSNPGDHNNTDWDPLKYPESLLLEIEQGIMIRPVQKEIATNMRSPPGNENSVMQLNMGEGKSTVIVPIVAAALADDARLVRVVVAKPQSSQMTHMLISRLGGLMNRRVFYLPISRSIRLSKRDIKTLRGMINKCRVEGGVFLAQPEHLLSFKLMGLDRSWPGEGEEKNTPLGKKIITLYREFESTARDIVDESDENCNVKFELIYTIGTQEAVEMSPDRWILIQGLLDLTETVVRGLMAPKEPGMSGSGGFLFEERDAGRVPVIRVLEDPAGRQLIEALAHEVCRLGVRGLPVHHQTAQMRRAVGKYILLNDVPQEDIDKVEQSDLFSNPTTRGALLLLRGLLAKGVLLFALGPKRFRVNYGLAPDRQPPTMMAVPYRAKDMPSLRSEFSHPDVVIVLTCLSYYYRGLSDQELYTCFELLSNSDQANEEYARWAAGCPKLPQSFRHFSAINIKDRARCEGEVFPRLSYAKPVVDFYLSRIVFPKEMKQFPFKLSASGWDLAKLKPQPLTGFSGTNDSKGVLPLSVKALDLQPQTNATVLSTILGGENTVMELGDGKEPQVSALTEKMLLGALNSGPSMQVVLDVGAQIIERSNLQMADKLLKSAPTSTDAVIFFNDQDELSVLTRNDVVDSFLTSPFARHTDRCLVFLDQAHTRGTDLKLPDHYRAAVTLGPGVTKDTLVQACMRMRKLGQGQSVTFIVSPEMQKRIRSIRNITDGRPLAVRDVIAWAISEAWDEATRSVPLWAMQGKRHLRQEAISREADASGGFSLQTLEKYLEPEAMSLDDRYRPKHATSCETDLAAGMASLRLGAPQNPYEVVDNAHLAAIEKKLAAFKDSTRTAPSATLQEEQERELAPEIEEERHLARPPPRKALHHDLHPDVKSFILTGRVLTNSRVFTNPWAALSNTSAASLFNSPLYSFPTSLLATRDFTRTVDDSGPGYRSDAYQRSVQWIVTHGPERMVLVSPHEASWIKRVLDANKPINSGGLGVTLHAYLPRTSLAFPSMEYLTTYTVPAVAAGWTPPTKLVRQLNLFAGQLYLRSRTEYVVLCAHLGLACAENMGEKAVAQDGFVGRRGYPSCKFKTSPVAFLAEVYSKVRRDCVGIEKTHMGRVLAGEVLRGRDFGV